MLFLKIVANNTWYYILNKRAYYLSILLLISFNIMIIYFLINFGMDIIFIIISFLFFLILIFFTLGLKNIEMMITAPIFYQRFSKKIEL